MKAKVLTILLITLMPSVVIAKDINCKGLVTRVMDYPGRCNGNKAFKTSASNGIWISPPTEQGNAIISTALAADKKLQVYIDSQRLRSSLGYWNPLELTVIS